MDVKLFHKNALIPTKAHTGDAGWDLYVAEKEDRDTTLWVNFGVGFDIPEGVVGLVFPRSSVVKTNLTLANCVGVIDPGYKGSVSAVFDVEIRHITAFEPPPSYEVGDRAAQIVFVPLHVVDKMHEVSSLGNSDRGDGGFGSSGK